MRQHYVLALRQEETAVAAPATGYESPIKNQLASLYLDFIRTQKQSVVVIVTELPLTKSGQWFRKKKKEIK